MPALSSPVAEFCQAPHRVLIVDESPESREVLRTALERRGITIFETAEARQGLSLARQHHPEVIVLDLDAVDADQATVQAEYAAESQAPHVALVILGRARQYRESLPHDRIVAKPYHYAPLVRKIEQLVDQHRMP